jgi:hypothetical protein
MPIWGGNIGGNVGTVTSVASGTGLTGGPVTSSGTLALTTAIVPAVTTTYVAALTLDAYGRATAMTPGGVFGVSGASHGIGLVPDPGATPGSANYLREDGTWDVPAGGGGGSGTVTSITANSPLTGGTVTSSGSFGLSTAIVGAVTSTYVAALTVDNYGRVTAVTGGGNFVAGGSHARGLVPDPGAGGGTTKYLREDASWQVPSGGGGGLVNQVVSVAKTDVFSSASTTYVDVTGLTANITCLSTSSRVMVTVAMALSTSSTGVSSAILLRGATPIAVGDASGSHAQSSAMAMTSGSAYGNNPVSLTFVDSPASVSALTYKVQVKSINSSSTYINRTLGDGSTDPRMASTITLVELTS